MESLLTLSIGDYHAVDVALRLAAVLVAATAALLALSSACVERRLRFPLLLSATALAAAAWFGSGIAGAWRGAFELAGSSYCVTGLPLASEDRVLAWAFGIPVVLFCIGLAQLDHGSKQFRILCWATLGMAIFGPFLNLLFLIGFVVSVIQLRSLALDSKRSPVLLTANRFALAGMVVGVLFTELGALHLLPLGKTAESILLRGELIRSLSDILALSLPGVALLTGLLNLDQKAS